VQGLLWGAGKSILGVHRTYKRMFRESNEGGEREGSQWFREEQVWENRGSREEKETALCKQALGWMPVQLFLHLTSAVCPGFSLNSMSRYFPVCRALWVVCLCVWEAERQGWTWGGSPM